MDSPPGGSSAGCRASRKCQICNDEPATFHFGAISCKACAAFFRRFVNSKKTLPVHCTCWEHEPLKLCRFCRVEKCIAAGMRNCCVRIPKTHKSPTTPDFEQNVRLAQDSIIPKDFDKMLQIRNAYNAHRDETEIMKFLTESPRKTTMKQWSALWKNQFEIMWKMSEKAFPELQDFSDLEKNVLLNNFSTKWLGFSSAMIKIKVIQANLSFACFSADVFYEQDAFEKFPVSKVCLKNMFMPYWTAFTINIFKPLWEVQLDEIEVVFLIALLLFDPAYPDLTPQSMELCYNLRKVVQKQLILYHQENEKPIQRLADVLNILVCVEKSEGKLYEEMQLCALHGITVDDAFLKVLKVSRM